MKHIYLKNTIIMAVLAAFLLSSCSDEQDELISSTNEIIGSAYNSDGVKVVNNVVYFKDSEAFSETMKALELKSEQELETWEFENNFTKSYRKVLNGTSEDSLA